MDDGHHGGSSLLNGMRGQRALGASEFENRVPCIVTSFNTNINNVENRHPAIKISAYLLLKYFNKS